jgi:hypothetical protein
VLKFWKMALVSLYTTSALMSALTASMLVTTRVGRSGHPLYVPAGMTAGDRKGYFCRSFPLFLYPPAGEPCPGVGQSETGRRGAGGFDHGFDVAVFHLLKGVGQGDLVSLHVFLAQSVGTVRSGHFPWQCCRESRSDFLPFRSLMDLIPDCLVVAVHVLIVEPTFPGP